jgi:hypothetical protein
MNRNYKTPTVDEAWATSRETDMPVAVAIHAIASHDRTPETIWEDPTPDEWQHVQMAVQEYVGHDDFPADPSGYCWGQETVPHLTKYIKADG